MELRNTLGRLEEEILRYRQRSTEHQVSHVESCERLKPRCSKFEDRIRIKALRGGSESVMMIRRIKYLLRNILTVNCITHMIKNINVISNLIKDEIVCSEL